MPRLRYKNSKGIPLLSVFVLYALIAFAKSAKNQCGPAPVIIIGEEAPAKIITYPPLAEPQVLVEVADANHRILDKGLVTLVVPEKNAAEESITDVDGGVQIDKETTARRCRSLLTRNCIANHEDPHGI